MNNHHRGAALEDLLEWQHNVYRSNQRAYLWHNGTQGIIRRGQTILVRSQVDYSGILTGLDGRYVAFDAKLMQRPKPLKDGRMGAITYTQPLDRLHQLTTLYDVQEAGGVSFLLISLDLEWFYLIWVDASWRLGRPYSIRLDQLQAHQGVEFGRGGGNQLPDWLSVIQEVYDIDDKEKS